MGFLGLFRKGNRSRLPDAGRAHMALRTFAAEGDWETAITWGRVAVEANPSSADIWNDLGFALNGLAQARWDTLPPLADRPEPPAGADPTTWLAHLGDSGIRRALAREEAIYTWEQAADAFEHALAIRPEFAEAYNNYGVALVKLDGRAEEAKCAFEAAIRLRPDYTNARTNLAVAERALAQQAEHDPQTAEDCR